MGRKMVRSMEILVMLSYVVFSDLVYRNMKVGIIVFGATLWTLSCISFSLNQMKVMIVLFLPC